MSRLFFSFDLNVVLLRSGNLRKGTTGTFLYNPVVAMTGIVSGS